MFDPLKKEKLKLQQASINAQLATKYTQRQFDNAKLQSKGFISSPSGIIAMFAAGSISGASGGISSVKSSPSMSTLISLLVKFF